jgi:hypothetical protein
LRTCKRYRDLNNVKKTKNRRRRRRRRRGKEKNCEKQRE